mmetsp:Transcript_83438/g.239680  ORF Transcript_83438/g.239680 Transcript_83438/m.239680 type:complete len:103 (-) Transcript_83438:1096-1404(-)
MANHDEEEKQLVDNTTEDASATAATQPSPGSILTTFDQTARQEEDFDRAMRFKAVLYLRCLPVVLVKGFLVSAFAFLEATTMRQSPRSNWQSIWAVRRCSRV